MYARKSMKLFMGYPGSRISRGAVKICAAIPKLERVQATICAFTWKVKLDFHLESVFLARGIRAHAYALLTHDML